MQKIKKILLFGAIVVLFAVMLFGARDNFDVRDLEKLDRFFVFVGEFYLDLTEKGFCLGYNAIAFLG
jgi:hypothetical protein